MERIIVFGYTTDGFCNKCGNYFLNIKVFFIDDIYHKMFLCDECIKNNKE